MDGTPETIPAAVRAFGGNVIETKPDGTNVAMTPDAAAKTAAKLLEAASLADGDVKLSVEYARRRDKDEAPQSPSGM